MQSIIDYIKEKYKYSDEIQDELWHKGKTFTIYNKDGEDFSLQEYGSYVDDSVEYNGEKIIEKEIYEDFDYGLDSFDGWRAKQYFLLDSKFFDELIEEKKKDSNCCFVTSADDLLKEGYVPKQTSILLLEADEMILGSIGRDKLASRFLNHFGVPTAYYDVAHEIEERDGEKIKRQHTVSIDFLKPNQKFISVCDYYDYYLHSKYKFYNVEKIVDSYENIFKEHYRRVAEKSPADALSEEELNAELSKMKEDISYMVLCRKYALGDEDFASTNMGVIVDEQTKKISIAPAFDLEYLCVFESFYFGWTFEGDFKHAFKNGEGKRFLEHYDYDADSNGIKHFLLDLKYIQENHPQVIDKFVLKSNELLFEKGKTKLNNFVNEYYEHNSNAEIGQREGFVNRVVEGLGLITNICECFSSNYEEPSLVE